MKKKAKPKPKRKRRYRYTLRNEHTGLGVREPFTRIIYEIDDEAAKERIKYIKKCFGRGTEIVKFVRLKEAA